MANRHASASVSSVTLQKNVETQDREPGPTDQHQ